MKKKNLSLLLCSILTSCLLSACGETPTSNIEVTNNEIVESSVETPSLDETAETDLSEISTDDVTEQAIDISDAESPTVAIPEPIIRMTSEGFRIDSLDVSLDKTQATSSYDVYNCRPFTYLMMNFNPSVDVFEQQSIIHIHYIDSALTLEEIANERGGQIGYVESNNNKYLYSIYTDGRFINDESAADIMIFLVKDNVLVGIETMCIIKDFSEDSIPELIDSLFQEITSDEVIDDSLVYTANGCIYLPVFGNKIAFVEEDFTGITKVNSLRLNAISGEGEDSSFFAQYGDYIAQE